MRVWLKRLVIVVLVLILLGTTAVGAFIAGVTSGLFAQTEATSLSEEVIAGEGIEAKVGVLRMEGLIVSAGGDSLFPAGQGMITASQAKRWLREIAADDAVRGLVIEMNSPGGSPVAADEIYNAIKVFRSSGKSVVVVMEDTATSGAYFVSVAADAILASPATLTGSIGVIAEIANVSELLDKVGVDLEVYKSGQFKDFTSFSRDRTEEEKALIQEYIDDAYDLFISRVVEGRKMDESAVRALSEGQIYSGQKALELGLIDGLGSVEEGIDRVKALQGLGDVKIVRYRTESALDLLLGRVGTVVNPLSSLARYFAAPGLRAAYLPTW